MQDSLIQLFTCSNLVKRKKKHLVSPASFLKCSGRGTPMLSSLFARDFWISNHTYYLTTFRSGQRSTGLGFAFVHTFNFFWDGYLHMLLSCSKHGSHVDGSRGLGVDCLQKRYDADSFYNPGPNSKFDIDDTWFRPAFLGSGAGTGGWGGPAFTPSCSPTSLP